MGLYSFYRISKPSKETVPSENVDSAYRSIRRKTFWGVTVAYSLYYVCRLSLSVMKQPLIDEGVLSAGQLGLVGSSLFFVYAVGKFINGFIADYCNIRRFMATGLFISAVVNLLMGVLGLFHGPAGLMTTIIFVSFAILWGINGWMQSMGSPPGNPAAFGNRPLFLGQYGFRMANVTTAGGWQIPNRLPAAWAVKVSDKENPASDDDWVLVDSHSGLTYSFYGPVNGCYTADFSLELPVAFRHVRFSFTGSTGNNDYVQLGEICMSGLIGPYEAGRRDVCLYKTSPVSPNADGSATAKASILPAGAEVDPYDIFVTYRTGDHADTNWLARATQFTGLYETTIPGLRLGSDYTLQFGTVAANGTVELGEVVEFSTPLDIMPAGVLPAGYTELEYIESTDTGHQYIDCGFAPSDVVLGFDLDFIGYNEFMRGAYHDTDNRKTGYGVYLSSTVKGQNAQVLVSSSTGGSGGYPDGLFVYDGVAMNARLTKGERMSVLLGNGKYTTICGAVTNAQNKTRLRITGPTLSLFASENGPGNDPDQFAAMRLYSLKVYDDTVARTLTHEFVPAKRQSDNAIGVYDVVANAWRPNGSATPFLAGPAVVGGDILTIGSVSFVGRTLTVTLNRNGASTAEADVYALWGADYAAMDTAGWEHTARLGAFAENAQTAKFMTPDLVRGTVYVRFYTADGKWSETIYLPDQPVRSSGFIYIVR